MEQVKAEAIESGRPVAAWDKDCIAWQLPEADSEGQEWANEVATAFFKAKGADCPDAIVFPHYYIDEIQYGGDGELVLIIDQEMNRILHGPDKGEFENLYRVSYDFMQTVEDEFPDLKTVKAQLRDGDRHGTMTRGEERRSGGDGLH